MTTKPWDQKVVLQTQLDNKYAGIYRLYMNAVSDIWHYWRLIDNLCWQDVSYVSSLPTERGGEVYLTSNENEISPQSMVYICSFLSPGSSKGLLTHQIERCTSLSIIYSIISLELYIILNSSHEEKKIKNKLLRPFPIWFIFFLL